MLAALGTAVSAFREKLGEALASVQRYDVKIEEASTPSLEALKAYSQGTRTRRTTGDFDSVPFFKHAIESGSGVRAGLRAAGNGVREPVATR